MLSFKEWLVEEAKKPKKKNMAALPPDELNELMVAIANAAAYRNRPVSTHS